MRQLVLQNKYPYIRMWHDKHEKILITKSALLEYLRTAACQGIAWGITIAKNSKCKIGRWSPLIKYLLDLSEHIIRRLVLQSKTPHIGAVIAKHRKISTPKLTLLEYLRTAARQWIVGGIANNQRTARAKSVGGQGRC